MQRPFLELRDCFGCGRELQPFAETNGLCGPCRGERRDGFIAARRQIAGDPIEQPREEA